MKSDLVLPSWEVLPHEKGTVSDQEYLAWLAEEREALIKSNQLRAHLADPARCPVDVRFIWNERGDGATGP